MFRLILLCVFFLASVCHADDACHSVCESTYPLHTVGDKVGELRACLTGCRMSFLSQLSQAPHLITNDNNKDVVQSKCFNDCNHGYAPNDDVIKACQLGCQSSQVRRSPIEDEDLSSLLDFAWHRQLLHPFVHIRNVCNTMYSNAASYVFSSVNFNDGTGGTIVMQVELHPRHQPVIQLTGSRQMNDVTDDVTTKSHWLKHYADKAYDHVGKWLNCVERKSGIPSWALLAFITFFFVFWIGCTSCDDDDVNGRDVDDDIKKHTFKDDVMSVVADPVYLEKPPPYFLIVAGDADQGGETEEAGPLPEKKPLLDEE